MTDRHAEPIPVPDHGAEYWGEIDLLLPATFDEHGGDRVCEDRWLVVVS